MLVTRQKRKQVHFRAETARRCLCLRTNAYLLLQLKQSSLQPFLVPEAAVLTLLNLSSFHGARCGNHWVGARCGSSRDTYFSTYRTAVSLFWPILLTMIVKDEHTRLPWKQRKAQESTLKRSAKTSDWEEPAQSACVCNDLITYRDLLRRRSFAVL